MKSLMLRVYGHLVERSVSIWIKNFCLLACCTVFITTGCAGHYNIVPGKATVWGYVKLTPRNGINATASQHRGYADRRYDHAVLLDYSAVDYAAVYVDQGTKPGGVIEVNVVASTFGTKLYPEYSVVGVSGSIVVHNQTEQAQIVSSPEAAIFRVIEPNEKIELPVNAEGEYSLFVPSNTSTASAKVFAAPGSYTEISATGRWGLEGLSHGVTQVKAWHPRFPLVQHTLDLSKDTLNELLIEFSVNDLTNP